MRTLKLLTIAAMVAAVLALAPPANAQDLPTVTVTAGPAITEGERAAFRFVLSEPAESDLEVHYELEETERVADFVNSDLVPDPSEGSRTVTFPAGRSEVGVIILTTADGVHEDSQARDGRTNPLTATIQAGSGYTIGDPSSATVQVGDDEPEWGTTAWEDVSVDVAEEDGLAELAVTLSKPYSYPLTLEAAANRGTARGGEDFDVDSANVDVTIPARSRRVAVPVGIVDDEVPEYTESFGMLLLVGNNPVRQDDGLATVTITDSDECVDAPVDSTGQWCVHWSATALAEGESVTVRIGNPDDTVADSDEILVTLHIGRTEGTADVDDILVREHAASGQTLRVQPYPTPNVHHKDGWIYISQFLPFEEARDWAMTVEALDNLDGADSETLATWVYVNGDLAGAQVLTITDGPEPQQ